MADDLEESQVSRFVRSRSIALIGGVAVAASLLTAPAAQAVETTGSISGTITATDGVTADDVYVIADAVYPSTRADVTLKTDESGHYEFSELPADQYHIVVMDLREGKQHYTQYWTATTPNTYYDRSVITLSAGEAATGRDVLLYDIAGMDGHIECVGCGTYPGPFDGNTIYISLDRWDVATSSWVLLAVDDAYPVNLYYQLRWMMPGSYRIRVQQLDTNPQYQPIFTETFELVEGQQLTRNFWVSKNGAQSTTFWDVPKSHTFYLEIEEMFRHGISTGVIESGTGLRGYHGTQNVSRAAMAAFLYRAAGSPAFTAPATPSFTDVPASDSFFKEIEWMKSRGISTGTSNGNGSFSFKPSDPVSRQAMSAFLYRYKNQPVFTAPETPSFSDVPTSAQFYMAIEWMMFEGITTGSGGLYKPTDNVSRQAMAAFLYRLLN